MTLIESLMDAIERPADWDIPGLMQDAIDELDRIPGMESELADYGRTVQGLRRKLEASERMRLKAYECSDEGMAEHEADTIELLEVGQAKMFQEPGAYEA
jgi:hypothetical protein